MAKRKISKIEKISYALVGIMVLALILSFDAVSDEVGKVTNTAGDKINDVARIVFGTALGLFLINTGVASLAVPVVGVALIAIGIVLVGASMWPVFKGRSGE